MTTMSLIWGLIAFFTIVTMLIALIKPTICGPEMTRGKVVKQLGLTGLLFITLAVICTEDSNKKSDPIAERLRQEEFLSAAKHKAELNLPIVTYAEYRRIQDGMSYREVVQIIGAEGKEISRNRLEGVRGVMETTITVMYQWGNKNGGNMNAMFQNDKMIQKAQFGLE